MNKFLKIAAVLLLCLVLFSFVRDLVLKTVVTAVASKTIGAPVRMDGFSLSLIRQSVRIKGLRIYNPPGFPKEAFVDIPTVAVSWDLPSIVRGKLHFRLVEFDLKEFILVKNKEGKMNVDSLKVVESEEKKEQKKPVQQIQMQIDLISLQIGRMVQKDYAVSPTSIQVREINIKKSYKNITNPQQLAVFVLTEPMKSAGIKSAAIYAASAMTGVGIIPVAVGAVFMGNDKAEAEYNIDFNKVYAVVLEVVKKMGSVKSENKKEGVISADLPGGSVTVKVDKVSFRTTKVTVSARKMMMPKPEVAGGVLYQISNRLR